ncbi:hypothetical protein E2C01_073633 [Portunus trituberculatus]|uniref:Uncharacterized protein n=1 Tax=Portunus trituberculatus TaxID=210409 RepID=A0A5B7I3I9_PORTR|nr:hypothetical protein [Portunus trituberculatus]
MSVAVKEAREWPSGVSSGRVRLIRLVAKRGALSLSSSSNTLTHAESMWRASCHPASPWDADVVKAKISAARTR